MSKSEERDENGRFLPGNSGGPGRPARATEREYLTSLVGRVTLDDWAEVVDKAVEDAKVGDSQARKWLSEWLLRGVPILADVYAAQEIGHDEIKDAVERIKAPGFDKLLSEFAKLNQAVKRGQGLKR